MTNCGDVIDGNDVMHCDDVIVTDCAAFDLLARGMIFGDVDAFGVLVLKLLISWQNVFWQPRGV